MPVYQDWVRSFGPDAEHIFIGHGCCEVRSSFLASSLHRYGLYSISSEAFAPQRRLEGEFCSQFLSEAVQSSSLKVVVGRSLLRIGVSPLKKAINEDVLSVCLQSQETTKEEITARIPAIVEKIDSYRRKHSPGTPLVAPLIDFGDDRFIFLGTGCAIPSKYRNVSGILHFMSCSRSGLLMDCGEGTWFQLISICPSVVLPDFQPSSLLMEEQDRTLAWARIVRVVWISHAHADHHLGLITLILERQRSLRRVKEFTPIVIIAPYQVLQFLNHVSANVCKEMAGAYLPVPCHLFDASRVCGSCSVHDDGTGLTDGSTRDTEQQQQQSTYQVAGSTKRMRISRMEGDAFDEEYCRKNLDAVMSILVSVGISQLLNVPVIHCPQAYGLVVERSKGGKTMKIAYSGDTRPSDLFVHFASGATVLIHEATFEDDKLEEAIQKKHSTINEALLVGKQIGAYRTILTHFSQRYHGVPAQLRPSGDEVDIMHVDAISASDFMCLRVADLPWAPILTSALYDLLPPQTDEVEDELEGK